MPNPGDGRDAAGEDGDEQDGRFQPHRLYSPRSSGSLASSNRSIR